MSDTGINVHENGTVVLIEIRCRDSYHAIEVADVFEGKIAEGVFDFLFVEPGHE